MSDEVEQVTLTEIAYECWIRAHKPQPIQWFLGLDPMVQKALAAIGDAYVEEICEGLALRLEGVREEAEAVDADEEAYIKKLAAEMLNKQPGNGPSFAGIGERRRSNATKHEKPRKLFGKLPDAKREQDESVADATADQK